ncbi:MAG: restriction endonuclease, partial [Candidatus Woesearchaeota archaeon]|nr:restriction endonuclease [Candidatus Woesearchaeota archaeon]
MKEYLTKKKSTNEFKKKSPIIKLLINQSIFIFDSLGTPLNGLTPRRLERMALSFLALAGIKRSTDWNKIKSISDSVSMKSRDIITYINKNLQDNISSGSYDDIRRKDLKLLVLNGVVVRTKPGSARNDSTRGYAISKEHAEIIRLFGSKAWEDKVKT